MTIQTKTVIIGNFQNGDVPSGTDFQNWIESCITAAETSAQSMTGTLNVGTELTCPIVSGARGTFPTTQVTTSLQVGVATVSGIGSAQSQAQLISKPYNVLTPTAADNAYILPGGYQGDQRWFRNKTAVSANIFPPSGGSINGGTTNAAYSIPGSARVMIVAESSASFYTWRITDVG